MKYFFFLLTLLATRAGAQTTTRGMKWFSKSGKEYTYIGEIQNGKPQGIGLAISNDKIIKIFGQFSNGVIEGAAAIVENNGYMTIGTNWINGDAKGDMAVLTSDKTLRYGYMEGMKFEGKLCEIFSTNHQMRFCNMKGSVYTGRALTSWSDGHDVSANYFENNKKNGRGYQYELDQSEVFRIVWKDDIEVNDATFDDYPSFLANSSTGAEVNENHVMLYSGVDADHHPIDTCFILDKHSNLRYFGFFEHGKLIDGMKMKPDSAMIIGKFNFRDEEKEGFCVDYEIDNHLDLGNYKNGLLEGFGIRIELTFGNTNPSIYIGEFHEGKYRGNGARALITNEIIYGHFTFGYPMSDCNRISQSDEKEIKSNVNTSTNPKKTAAPATAINDEFHPKNVCTAINYLVKAFTNGFRDINTNETFNPDGSSEVDPFVTENPTKDYKSLFYFPGAKVNKIYDAYKQQGFYFGIAVSDQYSVIKKKYDDLCRQLTACPITSLQKRIPMKLSGKAEPAKPGEGAITTLYVAPYPGRTRTPKIVIIMEKAALWQLTGRIISYQEIE